MEIFVECEKCRQMTEPDIETLETAIKYIGYWESLAYTCGKCNGTGNTKVQEKDLV